MIDSIGWLIFALACFFLVALVFDRYGSHNMVQQTNLDEENLPPESTPQDAKPSVGEERSKFLESLPLEDGPSFVGMDAEGNSLSGGPATEIKEIYPERLAKLRRHIGFRSATFESFWRGATGEGYG